MRYLIKFGYDGTKFHGFQRQNDVKNVQGTLENALSKVLKSNIYKVFRWSEEQNTFVRDKRLDCKIPNNYWIAFHRVNADGTREFRAEELQK